MMRNILLKACTSIILSFIAVGTIAQTSTPSIIARITPDSIMIGDRFTLDIDVDKDVMQSITFPHIGRRIVASNNDDNSSIECIEELPIDTISQVGRRLHLRKRYIMAAFDEGNYSFGRAQVFYADKNIVDTLYADDSLRISVATFQIDSTSNTIFDIKPQKDLPFRFGEISGYLIYVLSSLIFIGLIIWGIVWWLHKHGRRVADIFRPAPPLPPHVVAISALEALHNRKLWQNNKHKQYYSALSDILRTYIAGRYGVGAMEMTTDKIAVAIRDIDMPPKCSMNLISVLRDSDLVKFAKAVPNGYDNEDAYNKAYWFVEETKPVDISQKEDMDTPTTNADATEKTRIKI